MFSIYADSPSQESGTSTSASTARQPKKSPSKQRPTTARKVLGAVPATAPASGSAPQTDAKGNPLGDATALKSKAKSIPVLRDAVSPEVKKVAARRKREASGPAVPRGETMATATTTTAPTDDTRTPAKKTRTTPRRAAHAATTVVAVSSRTVAAELVVDQENIPMIQDSPASCTRSRTRARAPLAPVAASPSVARRAISASTLEAMIGDGRGALSTSSGRAVARYLKTADDADVKEMDNIMQGEQVIGKAKSGRVAALLQRHEASGLASSSKASASAKHATPTKGKGKGLAVLGDGPLVDVSEAYGASGHEPSGFRD